MKNYHLVRYSKRDKIPRHLPRSHAINSALLGAAFLSMLSMSGCSSEASTDNSVLATDPSMQHLEANTQSSANIEESIKNSYARLASKRSDVCPKLLQDEQRSQTIERISEVMVNDYCDYFLYPEEGQELSVKVDNNQIETLLIVPTLHNFANGNYQVTSYDKHVVRLSYNGATHKPESLTYNVAIKLSDKQYL
ncbi:hypothetical protein [Psychrobacter sp. NG27]|uniref:hypothetical protein n=1 Tax=Psychrobacter sp. NG27 TaxID=2781966 RepID=UPI0018DFD270|nr:hypothetical protein [Psychrobacter sp. NG27]MBI0426338.1 hypothetical protein [Psychrobacter sp. NG27]